MSYIRRLESLPVDEYLSTIDDTVANTHHLILESDEFEQAADRTSAVGWAVDDYEVTDVEFGDDECVVRLTYSASGEQLEDHFFAGDRIDGEAEMAIDAEGHVSCTAVTAEVSDGSAWEGEGVES